MGQRFAWGEERVFFVDPQTRQIRSLPLAWTSLAPPDPYLVIAAGHTVRLTVSLFLEKLSVLPIFNSEDRYVRSYVRVPARGQPLSLSGPVLASGMVPTSAFP